MIDLRESENESSGHEKIAGQQCDNMVTLLELVSLVTIVCMFTYDSCMMTTHKSLCDSLSLKGGSHCDNNDVTMVVVVVVCNNCRCAH